SSIWPECQLTLSTSAAVSYDMLLVPVNSRGRSAAILLATRISTYANHATTISAIGAPIINTNPITSIRPRDTIPSGQVSIQPSPKGVTIHPTPTPSHSNTPATAPLRPGTAAPSPDPPAPGGPGR